MSAKPAIKSQQKPAHKIARKSDIWHKIQKGILFDAFYDTETTDLDKRFAQITQFGGLITDLAGNILHSADYKGKISPYSVISPFAWVVQRLHKRDLTEGDAQYILAGKVMQFFRHASQLHAAPFTEDVLKMCREEVKRNSDGTTTRYYAYPLLDENGEIDWESVRIHQNLKKLSFYDQKTQRWQERSISAMSIGYNNVNADDQWMWTLLHMAGAENIFITHLAQKGKFRLDGLRVIEAAYAAGSKGEEGIQPGYKIDPVNGEKLLSFSQGDILQANTHIASELRSIGEGVTQLDGSYPDIDQLHGAYKDAVALAGLMHYVRRQAPDIVHQMENNTVWKDVIERLTEKQGAFGSHPIMTYVDKVYPYVSGKMISLIGTDQYRHNPKVALVFNLGVDPETFHFNGKKLKDLTPQEHASLIKSSARDQNGIYRIIRTHHSPRLLDMETGFAAGFNDQVDLPTLHKRAKYLRDQNLTDAIMQGLRLAQPRLHGAERLVLPQPEEELFNFSTLEMYDPVAGEDVQVHLIKDKIERLAQDSRRHMMLIRDFWLKAIEPDDDILLDDFSDDPVAEKAAVEKFQAKIKGLSKKLKDNNGVSFPEPDTALTDQNSVARYKIKLLFYARNHFAQGNLQDIGHNFWFEDKNGHRFEVAELKKWSQWRLDNAWQNDDLRICHERLNVTVPIIDRIIESLGYDHILGADVQKQLDASKALRHYGIPNLNGQDRWYTIPQAERDLQKILHNELMDADTKALEARYPGVWTSFVTQHHDAQSSLGSYQAYLEQKKQSIPEFTPQQQLMVGLDPHRGTALEKLDYAIAPENCFEVQVPDRYLENPPLDPVGRKPMWVLNLSDEFNGQSLVHAIKAGKEIILTGQSTGKKLHLPKVKHVPVPAPSGVWEDFYKAVKARNNESGTHFAFDQDLLALTGEGPYVVHNLRAINMSAQTLKIPKTHFEGLLDHELAGYSAPVQGVVIYDDGLDIQEGPVRLLEQNVDRGGMPSGWEVETVVKKARRLSLGQMRLFSDKSAQRYGYATADQMCGVVSALFASQKLSPDDPNNKVWVVDFKAIDSHDMRTGLVFYNPEQTKISAMTMDYLPD